MPKKSIMTAGRIAFLVGVFGAIIIGALSGFGAFTIGAILTTILILSGLVMGLFNIKEKETTSIMLAALVIGGGSGILVALPYFFGKVFESILTTLTYVLIPMAIVVAIITVIKKGKP